jgi:hypothetical protein
LVLNWCIQLEILKSFQAANNEGNASPARLTLIAEERRGYG